MQAADAMENEAQRAKTSVKYRVQRKSRYGHPSGNQKPWNAEGPMVLHLCESVKKHLAAKAGGLVP